MSRSWERSLLWNTTCFQVCQDQASPSALPTISLENRFDPNTINYHHDPTHPSTLSYDYYTFLDPLMKPSTLSRQYYNREVDVVPECRNIREKYSRKISAYRLAGAHPAGYVCKDAVPNIENVPGLKMKSNEQFANAENCNICKQPFNQQRGVNRHHCRFCASSICGECSRKKINNERACDFCFLKQHLKKQEHERRENFRQRELNIERMNKEIKDFEKEIEDLDKQIVAVDKANVEMEVNNLKEFTERNEAIKRRQEELKVKQEEYEAKKKELLAKKQQLETREERNKTYASKVQIIKLDISSKQAALLEKMEQLERLKLQLDKLESQRAQLLKEFK